VVGPHYAASKAGTIGLTHSYANLLAKEGITVSPVSPATNPVTDGYVASKRSPVFHWADCKSAAKIAAGNLVKYNTRDEAVKAGKRPCAEGGP
jgi:NAD(P)-dependent dehydrogenase (short-subunit alcohol dehydrogenase family)